MENTFYLFHSQKHASLGPTTLHGMISIQYSVWLREPLRLRFLLRLDQVAILHHQGRSSKRGFGLEVVFLGNPR